MIYVYDLYEHEYWDFDPLLADVTIWQEIQNGNYAQYLSLAVL
jgi:hypothetical protein